MGEIVFSLFVGICLVVTGVILNSSLSSELKSKKGQKA